MSEREDERSGLPRGTPAFAPLELRTGRQDLRLQTSHSVFVFSSNSPVAEPRQINLTWRRGRDSNPRDPFGAYAISSRAPSTTRPPLPAERLYRTERALHEGFSLPVRGLPSCLSGNDGRIVRQISDLCDCASLFCFRTCQLCFEGIENRPSHRSQDNSAICLCFRDLRPNFLHFL